MSITRPLDMTQEQGPCLLALVLQQRQEQDEQELARAQANIEEMLLARLTMPEVGNE